MHRIIKKIVHFLQALLNTVPVGRMVDTKLIKEVEGYEQPIIILGIPRSGTTLLYQMLCFNYYTAYPTNFAELMYSSPVVATKISNYLPDSNNRYESSYGFTSGIKGPSEATKLSRRWFEGAQVDVDRAKKEISAIKNIMGEVFVIKNLRLLLSIKKIQSHYPSALYIFVHRDEDEVCRSIYRARKKLYGSPKTWFGFDLPEVQKHGLSNPFEEIVSQVRTLKEYIAESQKMLSHKNYMTVEYRELCEHPNKVMESIEKFVAKRDLTLVRKDTFHVSKYKRQSRLLEVSNENYLQKLLKQ